MMMATNHPQQRPICLQSLMQQHLILSSSNANMHESYASSSSLSALDTTSISTSANGNNNNGSGGLGLLHSMLEAGDWSGSLARIASHPTEVQSLSPDEGLTALHVACDQDAPAVVLQALCKAWPQAAAMPCLESGMTPLHVICSSSHASAHAVRVLAELGGRKPFTVQDPDGDLALHTACRCGAPFEVLECLLRSYPEAASRRDLEGLTPLLRLWVRYFVTLGDDAIHAVTSRADLQMGCELGDAWNKTELLLKALYCGEDTCRSGAGPCCHVNSEFQFLVHAAVSVDCPRPIVQIAARVHPEQLGRLDHNGMTPLCIAAKAPVFKVRDLSEVGYELEDVVYSGDESSVDDALGGEDDENYEDEDNFESIRGNSSNQCNGRNRKEEPSVLAMLLRAHQDEPSSAACIPDTAVGRLPLHWALATRHKKRWNQGVQQLVEVYPEALARPDPVLCLHPFQLAATSSAMEAVKPNGKVPQDRSDVSTIFELLRANPSVIAGGRVAKARSEKDTVP